MIEILKLLLTFCLTGIVCWIILNLILLNKNE